MKYMEKITDLILQRKQEIKEKNVYMEKITDLTSQIKQGANERKEKMQKMKISGMTHDAIGKKYGLSRQRVHQILGTGFYPLRYIERIKKICLKCGKEFEVIPSHQNRKYCSRKCYCNSTRVTLNCVICGKEFKIYEHILKNPENKKRKQGKYCSRKCRDKGIGKEISKTQRKRFNTEQKSKRAKRLRKKGMTYKKIAEIINIGENTAWEYVNKY